MLFVPSYPNTIVKFVISLVLRFKISFCIALIGCLAGVFEHVILPYMSKLIIDGLQTFEGGNIFYHLRFAIIIGLLAWFGDDVLWRLCDFAFAHFSANVQGFVKHDASIKIATQRHEFFKKYNSGDILGRIINIARNASDFWMEILYFVLPTIINVIAVSLVVLSVSAKIALCVLVWALVHTCISVIFFRLYIRDAGEAAQAGNVFNSNINDVINNHTAISIFASSKHESARLGRYQTLQVAKTKAMLYRNKWMMCLLSACYFIFNGIFAMYIVITSFTKGTLSIGDVVMIMQLLISIGNNVFETTTIFSDVIEMFGEMKNDYKMFLDIKTIIQDNNCSKSFEVIKGEIELKNITFDYIKNEKDKMFMNYSMKIKAGQTVGIIGASGSGKSTLINLIMKEYDVDSGEILIDGISIKNIPQPEIMKHIAYIPQNTILFNRNIIENIKYGKPNASFEEVVHAAKLASVHDEIIEMERGYYTIAGEFGNNLSGGQRQRIVIARAILKNPKIIILDEATSALDIETEHDIRNALLKIMEDKTAIVIAHRLATVALLDRIVVFDDGTIVEDGTPDELLAIENGMYRQMVDLHIEDYLDDE